MTKLETAIINAAKKAQKDYLRITGGKWWLMHGPESFLQNVLALEISHEKNMGIRVYPECSPKRLKSDFDKKLRGRPPKVNDQQRFDAVFWWKNENPRAVLEIKLTNEKSCVLSDAKKLMAYSKEAQKLGLSSGYLLVYSEAVRNGKLNKKVAGKDTILKRFNDWETMLVEQKLPFKLINNPIPHEEKEELDGRYWAYGFALYKMDYPSK